MEIKDILEQLLKYKTVTKTEYDEIEKCINFIKEYFNNSNLYIITFKHNNNKSIYISNSKNKMIDVLFVGHIDVVSAEESEFIPYIKNKRLYGRGSFDMKGHVAVMMKILKDNKYNKKVGLLLTSDEEQGGFNGTNIFLSKMNYKCKIAIIPDAGNNFEIIDEEKGVLQLKVSYNGKKAHSSQPWNGNNAIKKILDLYNELLKKYPLPTSKKDYKSSINISKINGGNLTNEVADNCYAIFDIRHIIKDNKEDFIDFIKKYDKKLKVEIIAKGEPFKTLKENELYQEFLKSYKKILKHKVIYNKCESSSDGRFFYKKGIPCILMNAKGNNLHSKNEYIDLESLNKLYDIYHCFLKDT